MANGMYNLNVTFTPANAITVKYFGVYEVSYYCNISVDKETDVSLSVRTNGNKMPACTVTKHLTAGIDSTLSGSVIIIILDGAAIDMVISATDSTKVTFAPNTNASFSIKKLN